MGRLPPAPRGHLKGLCGWHLRRGDERRGRGWREQRGETHGQRRRGGGAGVGGGSLVAVAPLKGPGAPLHLAEAANGVEDDSGPVDGQLG